MNKLNATIVIIDDDTTLTKKDSGLMIELDMVFNSVESFIDQNKGLEYIGNNLDKRILVLLDLGFPAGTPDGHRVLELIRKKSFLIPVLIFSGSDENKEDFADLINNKAYAFIKKSASSKEIVEKLVDTYYNNSNDISIALEEWIIAHDDEQKEQPYIINANGKHLTLNNLLTEIRLQTNTGNFFAKNLLKLTIDLIARNKEVIND